MLDRNSTRRLTLWGAGTTRIREDYHHILYTGNMTIAMTMIMTGNSKFDVKRRACIDEFPGYLSCESAHHESHLS